MQPLSIVTAADDAYAMPLAVMLSSLASHLKEVAQLYVLDGGLTKHNQKRVSKSVAANDNSSNLCINWLQPDRSLFANLKVDEHVSDATYYRLLIPEILPQDLDKVIYLDCDLVLNSNIKKLWDIDATKYPVYAVKDSNIEKVSSEKGLLNYKELNIAPETPYFNAGVLLLNLALWRKEKLGRKVIDYVQNNREFIRWWDQDGLNAVLAGRWGALDASWNHITTPIVPEQEEKPDYLKYHIVHYATAYKPWQLDYKHPSKQLFFDYLDTTAWRGWRPKTQYLKKLYNKIRSRFLAIF